MKVLSLKLPDEMVVEIDAFAKASMMSRTGAVVFMCREYLSSRGLIKDLSELMELAKQGDLSDKG